MKRIMAKSEIEGDDMKISMLTLKHTLSFLFLFALLEIFCLLRLLRSSKAEMTKKRKTKKENLFKGIM